MSQVRRRPPALGQLFRGGEALEARDRAQQRPRRPACHHGYAHRLQGPHRAPARRHRGLPEVHRRRDGAVRGPAARGHARARCLDRADPRPVNAELGGACFDNNNNF